MGRLLPCKLLVIVVDCDTLVGNSVAIVSYQDPGRRLTLVYYGRYPHGPDADLLAGTLNFRYCTVSFAATLPTWSLPEKRTVAPHIVPPPFEVLGQSDIAGSCVSRGTGSPLVLEELEAHWMDWTLEVLEVLWIERLQEELDVFGEESSSR